MMLLKVSTKKIAHRFTILVIMAILCVFLITTAYAYYSDVREMEESITTKLEYTAAFISTSISDPVWDYDYDGVEHIGNSLFNDKEVALLIIRDDVSGVLYVHELTGEAYSQEYVVTKNRAIAYEGSSIGSITLGITDYYARERIMKKLQLSMIQLIVSVITLVIVVYFISYQITKPLAVLETNAKRLSEGKKRIVLSAYKDDEIGHLAKSFNAMGDIIEASSQKLHEINDSLEEKVFLRTEELMQKNSELNNALHSLKETQNELIQSSKLKLTTRLVSGVAHEINTPHGLTITIVTFLQEKLRLIQKSIEEGTYSEEDLYGAIVELEEASKSLEMNLRRVSQLMEHFRQLMLENQNQSATWFNVKDQLIKIQKTLMIELMTSNTIFEIVSPEDLIIKSFPSAFLQIITQLTRNAIHHGFDETDQGIIRLTCDVKDKQLLITFSDNGRGLSEEVKEHVFTPFYKGNVRGGGSGLGLAIVENIVNVHLGGHIRCISKIDIGTQFEIQIPVEVK